MSEPRKVAKRKKRAPQAIGAGCLMLFALPFAGFGIFAFGWAARDILAYRAAQSWVERPATLLAAKLERRSGDDGPTFEATARYRYEFNGQRYESTRVSPHAGGADNIGSYQEVRGRELERLFREKRPVTAYVNPADPTQALLYRELRYGFLAFKALFAVIFGGIGFGLIVGTLYGIRRERCEQRLQGQYPQEPWRWREAWLSGRVKSATGGAWVLTLFGLVWNAISWPAFLAAFYKPDMGGPTLLLVALFPLVGTALAFGAGCLWLRRWKWGVSEFEMATIPGVLGGPLAGVIHTPGRIEARQGIAVRLACVRRETSGDSSHEVTLWENERTIQRDLNVRGEKTMIPVQFIIPRELPDSYAPDVTWKLTAQADTTGVDYHAEFEVPVFATAASSNEPPTDAEENLALFVPVNLQAVAKAMRAVVEEDLPDRKAVYFPMARNRGLSIGLMLFTLVWAGVCVGLFMSAVPRAMAWVFSGFGALLAILAVKTAFERTRLEFGRRGVAYQRTILFGGKRHEFAACDIDRIEVDRSGTTSNRQTYWNVVLCTHDGERHTLATEIPRRQHADYLAKEIAAVAGVSGGQAVSGGLRLESELPAELQS